MTSTPEHKPRLPYYSRCALELYDNGSFHSFISNWWHHLSAKPPYTDNLTTVRDWLHGAMIAIPCTEPATAEELMFLIELIEYQGDILK